MTEQISQRDAKIIALGFAISSLTKEAEELQFYEPLADQEGNIAKETLVIATRLMVERQTLIDEEMT